MKRSVTVLLLTLSAAICAAQSITFGVKAGLNLSEQTHNSYVDYEQSLLTGFNAGGFIDFGFKNFSVQPGLNFTAWGEADKHKYVFLTPFNGGPGAEPSTTRLYYIQLPVNFLYRAKLPGGADIHFGGGPYVAYGIAEHDVAGGITQGNNSYTYKNPDFGLDAILGVTIKRVLVDAGFSYGITDIDNNPPGSTHNLIFSLSGGYLFK